MLNNIYIFGASTNGEQLLKICKSHDIKVNGFIDNFKEDSEFCGLTVVRPEMIDKNQIIIVTSPDYCYDIFVQLMEMGFLKVFNLSQFYQIIGLEPNWLSEIELHKDNYNSMYKLLADTKSKLVFDAIIRYRTTLDLFYPTSVCTSNQWFEFFKPGPHVIVDGGAYNGDTAIGFTTRCPEYKSIYLFEPCQKLSDESKKRLSTKNNIHYCACGLSNESKMVRMENGGLPGGKILENIYPMEYQNFPGNETTYLETLDEYVKEKITFIKLDIEGSEKKAILGAENHIRDDKPNMAIAVYHKPEDLWEIPLLIANMGNYKFYLRHHTQFYHETVLYCVK